MKSDKHRAEAPATVFEPLEPRLLLSGEAIAGIDPEILKGVPELVSFDYARPPSGEQSESQLWVTRTGSRLTAGDGILKADDLRALFGGITGEGVKIGVISDGVDDWEDVADAPYNDLPDSITIDPNREGSGNEGTAMLEIIHDIAPDADLYFSSGILTASSMAGAIEWLVGEGVDVIVDDIGWFSEPMFQDGEIAVAASDAVAEGVVYVTAAGNSAQTHYQGEYQATGGGNSFHLFHANDNILRVAVPTNGSINGVLQWSDEWGHAGNDYNLRLYGFNGQQWVQVDWDTSVQNGDDAPIAYVNYTNTPGYALLGWVIDRASGIDRELEFYTYGDITGIDLDDVTAADSIFGQAAVESVIAVGAIDASDSGNDDVEAWSSRGPSTIYTDFSSTQTPTTRCSLDVCGIDGVQTVIGCDLHLFGSSGNGYLFFGTSAAAPHIAGIAALLLQIDPTLTPGEIQDLITGNAADIGASGYDAVSGWGRADALATVTAAATAADLKAASDTGASSTDDLTNLDNSDSGKKLQFDVTGTISGATVTLYKGDDVIGSVVAGGTTTTVTTNGTYDLADGQNAVTARQTLTGKLESQSSASLTITVDTAAPTADVTDVSPDPRQESVSYITIIFSEAISGFGLGDLALKREGGSNLLTVSQ